MADSKSNPPFALRKPAPLRGESAEAKTARRAALKASIDAVIEEKVKVALRDLSLADLRAC
jgi:hypothetical protein